jgi:hypothetical protein
VNFLNKKGCPFETASFLFLSIFDEFRPVLRDFRAFYCKKGHFLCFFILQNPCFFELSFPTLAAR